MEPNDENFGGFFDVTDKIIQAVMEKVGIEQKHIDKAKDVIDMVDFTMINGESYIIVKIGENIEIRIKR